MVLLQLEIPLETGAAARPGREQGALVALNAALPGSCLRTCWR